MTGLEHAPRRAWSWLSGDEEATLSFGRALGQALRGGEIILLQGPLGAGKTRLAGGIAEGLAIARAVVSPTYIIFRSYPARDGLTLHHFDFYRLESAADLDTVGLEDCFGPRSVILAEWPERCPEALADYTLRVTLTPRDESTRLVRVEAGSGLDGAEAQSAEPLRRTLDQFQSHA